MASTRIVLQPAGQIIGRIQWKSSVSKLLAASTSTRPVASACLHQWTAPVRCMSVSIGHVGAEKKKPEGKTEIKDAQDGSEPEPPSSPAAIPLRPKTEEKAPAPTIRMVSVPKEEPKEPEIPRDLTVVEYVERFIPLTRSSVVRNLLQEKNFFTDEETKKFDTFALSLDAAVVSRYHVILQDLKSLFDPINPDKDTVKTRAWTRRERLDNEFWLIQKLAAIMEKANFQELPRSQVEKALAEHAAGEGVMVSVNMDHYDILRYWVLGKEMPAVVESWYTQMASRLLKRPPVVPLEFYKRVVVAVRLKKDDKLILKAFKEVPVNALEQLLPDGKVVMSKTDRGIITASLTLAGAGVVAKIVSYMAHVHMDWTMVVTLFTGLFGFRWWTVYKNRRNDYLLQLSRMLYFKNIANNRGLLTLLVDRAEDELFKELALTYSFLLTNRPPSVAAKPSEQQKSTELGAMTQGILEDKIEDWVLRKTGTKVKFDATEAIQLLSSYGILTKDSENNLFVQPLSVAQNYLPVSSQSVAPREQDFDSVEAFEYEETAESYQAEAKKQRRFGWF